MWLKDELVAQRALTGLINIIPTIMMGKMEMLLPDMYRMMRFIGMLLMGPKATSQDFLITSLSDSDER